MQNKLKLSEQRARLSDMARNGKKTSYPLKE